MTKTSMLVFSCNRPMQLDLLLKTFKNSIGYLGNIDVYVLYMATSQEFNESYLICKKENSYANFIQQGVFYNDIKNFINFTKSEFVLFCTDDTIFIRTFLIEEIENVFENDSLLNFSLRLGKNTVYCYPLDKIQNVPEHDENKNIFYWGWQNAEYDFGYPLEVSSTVLRVSDMKKFIEAWTFPNPNWMEWYMDMSKNNLINRSLSACFALSVAFSAPMNTVNQNNNNRSSLKKEYSVGALLKKYQEGYRINPIKFYHYLPRGAHEEVEFCFLKKGNL